MKSLIILILTAMLCLSVTGVLSADTYQNNLLSDEEVSLSAKSSVGIVEKIYWKKTIDGFFPSRIPFSFSHKGSDKSDFSVMIKHFDIFTSQTEKINSLQIQIDSTEVGYHYLPSTRKERWIGMKTRWTSDFFRASSYLSTGADADEPLNDVPLVAGIEGESSLFDLGILGKVNYIGNLNSLSSSSRMDFHVKSEYDVGDRWNSNLQLSWDIFGESREPYDPVATSAIKSQDQQRAIFSTGADNLSVVNAKVKCYPFRNLKLALNYYQYAQKEAKVSQYTPHQYKRDRFNPWASRITNGSDRDLGKELNVSADIHTGSGIYSSLLAGWYTPGDAYAEASGDENVFEIRGEIVVSF